MEAATDLSMKIHHAGFAVFQMDINIKPKMYKSPMKEANPGPTQVVRPGAVIQLTTIGAPNRDE
ncbi:MAG: hypothetical protein AAF711_02825 [Planctomycetota bacterium]